MNWLVGRNKQTEPETPVHRWALNAFKAALVSDTPPQAPVLESANATPVQAQAVAPSLPVELVVKRERSSSTASILKTPGALKEQRKSVTFETISARPAGTSKSGLPQSFPGKFPSPWTPRVPETQHNNDQDAASPTMKKEAPLNRFGGRRHLPSSLFHEQSPCNIEQRVPTPAKSRPTSATAGSLNWTVDKGFDELLLGFTRNNTTLQQMIAEMQESCANAQAEARLAPATAIQGTDSNATLTLDEPRSRSGQFWKQKFESLSGLSQTIQREQDVMQGMLLRLRGEVEARVEGVTHEWQDKCSMLRDELERERRAARALPSSKEARGYRQRVKELEQQVVEQVGLAEKLQAAELRVEALQSQLKAATLKAVVDVPTSSQPVPMSATAKRIAQATVKAQEESSKRPTALVHRVLDRREHSRSLSKDGLSGAAQRGSLLASRRQAIQQAKPRADVSVQSPLLHRGLSESSMSPAPVHVLADLPKPITDATPRPTTATLRKSLAGIDVNATLPPIQPLNSEEQRRAEAQKRIDKLRRARPKSSFHRDTLITNKENV